MTHRVRIASGDELGQLAASFNQMTDDLQKTTVSRDYVDNIIGSMIDALMVIDPETKIKTMNRAACELLGYREEELIGKPVKVIFASEEMPLKGTGLIESGELRNYETYYKAKNGQEIPVLFNASVMKDKDGNMTSIVCTGRDITERKQAEDQIKASLKEKEVLLKEIHHRVKNNLQVISSLLNLQAGYIEDEQALEMFKESQSRVRSMGLIHEKLYRSKDLVRIDFAEYLRNLTNYLVRSYGAQSNNIKLKMNVDDVYLSIDTAIPCGLIVNELVSNSIKHAFPAGREGEICINLSATTDPRHSDNNSRLALIVSDNGVGFPKNLDFRNTESLGLQLVNTLTDQLEGTIELDRSMGTKFKITFTESKY